MKSPEFKILVVDDDIEYAQTCARVIERAGYSVDAKGVASEAMEAIAADGRIRLVLSDLRMPGTSGVELLREIKAHDETIEVIIMTGFGSIESAIESIRARAAEYMTKPFDKAELLGAIGRMYGTWRLQDEARQKKQELSARFEFDGYLFKSERMADVYHRAWAASQNDCSVLITGESGTGKELVARAIHRTSQRAKGPFIAINCSTLSGELMESELFGHRRGAFTGAHQDHDGLFLAANNGTLLLDEIADMPEAMQAKLLRSLQNRTIRPVGLVSELSVDIRFIAATNANIQQSLSENRLRLDLFHRLNVIPIHLPPLREVANDIPDLVQFLITKINTRHQHTVRSVDEAAMDRLVSYNWPGNIRELENVIERIFGVERVEVVTLRNLPPEIVRHKPSHNQVEGTTPELTQAQRELVIRALHQAGGNKSKAAEILGISRPRLYKMIKSYGLTDL